jgi:predicted acylesterase/phospholipase RssA
VLLGVVGLLIAAWIFLALDLTLPLRAGACSGLTTASGLLLMTCFRGRLPKLYVVVLVFTFSWAVGGPWLLPLPAPAQFLVLVIAFAIWVSVVAASRSWICEKAFEITFFSPGGSPTLLGEIHGELDHVFCATELQSSEQLYFSKGFVAGYRYGVGKADRTTLGRAVQASACLPFAFAPRWFRRAAFDFDFPSAEVPPAGARAGVSRYLVLTDGGVYDNMATQWATGYEARSEWWHELKRRSRAPDVLIVVNASAGKGWERFDRSVVPGRDELAGMLRIKDTLYDQTTAPRRRALVAAFDQAAAARAAMEAAGDSIGAAEKAGLIGAIVDISQSPFDVARAFDESTSWPERARRAGEALRELGDTESKWDEQRRESMKIGTVLSRLGVARSASLVHHAYVLAAVNLSVILGFELPKPLPSVGEFEDVLLAR